jgi:hypothetical protein
VALLSASHGTSKWELIRTMIAWAYCKLGPYICRFPNLQLDPWLIHVRPLKELNGIHEKSVFRTGQLVYMSGLTTSLGTPQMLYELRVIKEPLFFSPKLREVLLVENRYC